jgi:DNA-binding response OmpR family regulator
VKSDLLDIHVIAVDDSPTILKIIEFALKKEVRLLETYSVPEEGLLAILQDEPDLIILDIMMPGLSGIELCKKIRADARFAETPLMYLTAVPLPQAIDEGMLKGSADSFMPKPFTTSQLVEEVRRLTAERNAERRTSGSISTRPWEP